jgi:hypothetical protein
MNNKPAVVEPLQLLKPTLRASFNDISTNRIATFTPVANLSHLTI